MVKLLIQFISFS